MGRDFEWRDTFGFFQFFPFVFKFDGTGWYRANDTENWMEGSGGNLYLFLKQGCMDWCKIVVQSLV